MLWINVTTKNDGILQDVAVNLENFTVIKTVLTPSDMVGPDNQPIPVEKVALMGPGGNIVIEESLETILGMVGLAK